MALALSAGWAHACRCFESEVQVKIDHSDVIFRGTITSWRASERPLIIPPGVVRDLRKLVVFRVSRVWKGDVGPIFEMPAVEETAACTGFFSDLLKIGTDLLVYARREGNSSEYYTDICGSHKLSSDAENTDFRKLGPGKIPFLRKPK